MHYRASHYRSAAVRRGIGAALSAGALACSAGSLDGSGASSSGSQGGRESSSTAGSSGRPLVLEVGGSGGASPAPPETCTAEAHEGQRLPVDMYFLLDSSGSMGERVQGGSKWEVVSGALIAFLNDPRNSQTAVGIGYFPTAAPFGSCAIGQPDCLCIPYINLCFANAGGSCSVADYSTPAVPLVLPASAGAVIADIQAHRFSGGTPTRPAVEGALQYLNLWAEQHSARATVLVLATDGDPTGCESNGPPDIAALAANALAGPHAIKTFVIGVGDSLVALNLVARAGGTGQAFLVDAGGDVAATFGDALEQIRGAAASCVFAIPERSAAGMKVNPAQVNVRYTPAGSTASTLVTQTFMSNPQHCDDAGGWYYDNPLAPTRIELCQSTCQALSQGSVQVEFGCDTISQIPR